MNNVKYLNYKTYFFSLLIVFILPVVTGCSTIKLITDYDEKTDEAITALQRKFETFFVDLESEIGTDQAKYENHLEFYKKVKVDISAVHLRVRALPQNEITEKQITLLRENIKLLEEFHKEGISSAEIIQPAREDFNRALANILKLELAKKRGEEV